MHNLKPESGLEGTYSGCLKKITVSPDAFLQQVLMAEPTLYYFEGEKVNIEGENR